MPDARHRIRLAVCAPTRIRAAARATRSTSSSAPAALAGGVSQAQAASELNAIARRLQEQYPVENARKRGVRLMTFIDGVAGPFRTSLWTLFAAVAAVLAGRVRQPRQPDADARRQRGAMMWRCSWRSARHAPTWSARWSSNRCWSA